MCFIFFFIKLNYFIILIESFVIKFRWIVILYTLVKIFTIILQWSISKIRLLNKTLSICFSKLNSWFFYLSVISFINLILFIIILILILSYLGFCTLINRLRNSIFKSLWAGLSLNRWYFLMIWTNSFDHYTQFF